MGPSRWDLGWGLSITALIKTPENLLALCNPSPHAQRSYEDSGMVAMYKPGKGSSPEPDPAGTRISGSQPPEL